VRTGALTYRDVAYDFREKLEQNVVPDVNKKVAKGSFASANKTSEQEEQIDEETFLLRRVRRKLPNESKLNRFRIKSAEFTMKGYITLGVSISSMTKLLNVTILTIPSSWTILNDIVVERTYNLLEL
jgi:hypothetical protein